MADFCRHAIRARDLAKRVDSTDVDKLGFMGSPGMDSYIKLRSAAESKGRAMLAAARTLRITNQSQLRAETAAASRSNAIPPEFGKPSEL